MNQRDNRRKLILLRLQGGERFTARQAAVDFEVDERTIRRDIDKLRTQGRFAIESDQRGFWMRKASRGERDPTDLRVFGVFFLAGGFIDSRYGTLDSDLGVRLRECLLKQAELGVNDFYSEHRMVRLNHPQTTEDDLRRIGLLGRSILCRGAMSFDYRNLESELEINREVLPLQIRESDGLWYLMGYCYYNGERRVYHLSRMKNLVSLSAKGGGPSEEQIAKWVQDEQEGIWLLGEGEAETVVEMRVTGYARNHVAERPIANYQKVLSDDGSECVLQVKVKGLTELMLWVRRFGPDVEILKPLPFREQCLADLKTALANYQSSRE